jgi:predicted MFS family arabinose efflux permease
MGRESTADAGAGGTVVEQLLPTQAPAARNGKRAVFWRNPARWLKNEQLSRGFWVFFTAAFFFDFGFSVYFFLFNLYLLDLQFNDRAIGLINGALTLGSVVGTLPAGLLARKIGLRPLLIVCLIAAPLLGALRAVVIGEMAQICLAFLAGLAMCLWGVCFLPAAVAEFGGIYAAARRSEAIDPAGFLRDCHSGSVRRVAHAATGDAA